MTADLFDARLLAYVAVSAADGAANESPHVSLVWSGNDSVPGVHYELFTGGDSDWIGDIRRLKDLGVTSVDVRLFGYGGAPPLQGTIDNMHRFRDGVLSRLA